MLPELLFFIVVVCGMCEKALFWPTVVVWDEFTFISAGILSLTSLFMYCFVCLNLVFIGTRFYMFCSCKDFKLISLLSV